MSDETPESAGFAEPAEEESVHEEAEPQGEAGPAAVSGVRRRTAPAPVRKKDLEARDADEPDAAIEALEAEFSDEDNDLANAVGEAAKAGRAPVRKGTATRKRSQAAREESDPYRAHNPVEFTRQSARELKQVVWPTWPELVSYFTAVLVFVLFFILFVGALDLLFGWSLLQLLGGK